MYEKEADEVIQLVFSTYDSGARTDLVANFLANFLGAANFGCTGMTATSPEGSTIDAVASGAEVLAGATDPEINGFLEAVRPPGLPVAGRLPVESQPDLVRRYIP